MGFSRQEHWSGLSFPSPGDLPDPWTEPAFPALAGILYHWATRKTNCSVYIWTVVFRKEMCFKGWVWVLPENKENTLLGGRRGLCKPGQCQTAFLFLRTPSSLIFLEWKVWGGRSGWLGWRSILWKNLCSTWVKFSLWGITWFLKQGNDIEFGKILWKRSRCYLLVLTEYIVSRWLLMIIWV